MVGQGAYKSATEITTLAAFSADLILVSLSSSTLHLYKKVMQDFRIFVISLEKNFEFFPATPKLVSWYISALYIKGISPATIRSKLSAIAF